MSKARTRPPDAPAGPTPTRGLGRIADVDGVERIVEVDLAESPLAWLYSRRDRDGAPLIDADEFEAGERLRRDYTIAGLSPRMTMNWDAFAGRAERRTATAGGGLLVTEAAMAARARMVRAIAAVGPDLGAVLLDVCCHLKGLGDVEKTHGWPLRSGKVVLRLALAALARHYAHGDRTEGPASAPIRHWGTPDYRPKSG